MSDSIINYFSVSVNCCFNGGFGTLSPHSSIPSQRGTSHVFWIYCLVRARHNCSDELVIVLMHFRHLKLSHYPDLCSNVCQKYVNIDWIDTNDWFTCNVCIYSDVSGICVKVTDQTDIRNIFFVVFQFILVFYNNSVCPLKQTISIIWWLDTNRGSGPLHKGHPEYRSEERSIWSLSCYLFYKGSGLGLCKLKRA